VRVQGQRGRRRLSLADFQKVLKELKSEFGAISSAILGRDGMMMAGDIPDGVTADTLTIMCATMMGAAVTAHSELRTGQPKLIRITSENHEMFITSAGPKAIIITVVPKGTNLEALQQMLLKVPDMLSE